MERYIKDMFPIKRKKYDFDDLSDEQEIIFNAFKNKENIYICGKAGTGKTTLLLKLIKYCNVNNIKHIVTASTGFASQHINGITLHHALYNTNFKEIDVLFIDEINMLGPYFIAGVCNHLANIKRKSKPFGGIQVVICGDSKQLEPVEDVPFTKSPLFKTFNFKKYKLLNYYRQNDEKFIDILNKIRKFSLNNEDHELLESLVIKSEQDINNFDAIRVFTKKKDVESYNRQKLLSMGRQIFSFEIEKPKVKSIKMAEYVNLFIDNLPIYEKIDLCIGCPVIIVTNINSNIVNGMRGNVKSINNNYVDVEFINGETHRICKYEWHLKKKGKTYGIIKQIPLILGWAISSHKCQCATFDKLIVSIDENIFAKNQVYTLLSRVRSLSDIRFLKYDRNAIK